MSIYVSTSFYLIRGCESKPAFIKILSCLLSIDVKDGTILDNKISEYDIFE